MAKQMMACGKCGSPIEVNVDTPILNNYETVTTMLIEHSGEVACVCGAILVPHVMNIGQIAMVLMPIPPERRKKLVLSPPTGRLGAT